MAIKEVDNCLKFKQIFISSMHLMIHHSNSIRIVQLQLQDHKFLKYHRAIKHVDRRGVEGDQ